MLVSASAPVIPPMENRPFDAENRHWSSPLNAVTLWTLHSFVMLPTITDLHTEASTLAVPLRLGRLAVNRLGTLLNTTHPENSRLAELAAFRV